MIPMRSEQPVTNGLVEEQQRCRMYAVHPEVYNVTTRSEGTISPQLPSWKYPSNIDSCLSRLSRTTPCTCRNSVGYRDVK